MSDFKEQRFYLVSVLAAFLLGIVLTAALNSPRLSPSAVGDRILGRLAKTGLKLLFFQEPPQEEPRQVMNAIGSDGFQLIDHGASL
jgi:hypothetical protein